MAWEYSNYDAMEINISFISDANSSEKASRQERLLPYMPLLK